MSVSHQQRLLDSMQRDLAELRETLGLQGNGEVTIPAGPNDGAPWMRVAVSRLGEHEVRGDGANPFILACHATTTLGRHFAMSDETPWCSSFVNWCLHEAGIEGTNSARARSWLGWGKDLPVPLGGCVVILRRGKWGHHVAFYTGHVAVGHINVLGGNQSDSVSNARYPESKVLGYRWPE